MADLRVTASSLLTTVTTVAETATSLVGSIGTGAAMLNDFATDAHTKQRMRIKKGMVGYEARLDDTMAIDILKSRDVLHEYITANPGRKADLDAILAELKAASA